MPRSTALVRPETTQARPHLSHPHVPAPTSGPTTRGATAEDPGWSDLGELCPCSAGGLRPARARFKRDMINTATTDALKHEDKPRVVPDRLASDLTLAMISSHPRFLLEPILSRDAPSSFGAQVKHVCCRSVTQNNRTHLQRNTTPGNIHPESPSESALPPLPCGPESATHFP